MSSLDKLNTEQRARIEEFKTYHGKKWKDVLAEMWWSGKDAQQADDHLLRQVRNQLGPQWLSSLPADKFNAPKRKPL